MQRGENGNGDADFCRQVRLSHPQCAREKCMEKKNGDATQVGSIFSGSAGIISSFLTLSRGESIAQKSTSLRIAATPIEIERFYSLANDLYDDFARRRGDRKPSGENWRWALQTRLDGNNRNAEALLERAVAILTARGHIRGWSNQMPVASGLVDEYQDKRAAIDLARLEGGRLDLIELKWRSDTPLFAAFEIFLYAIAYLFCRAHMVNLGYYELKTMRACHVTFKVLAPRPYYEGLDLLWLQRCLAAGLEELSQAKLDEPINVDFGFFAFPHGFELPFENGTQVIEACSAAEPGERARVLLHAINHIAPLYLA
jgi:hypothetical protein